MAEFYLGQIMMTGFGFAQKGFAPCAGGLLPISQYNALFSLLGVQFGGNGTTNFQLPNLQGQAPVGAGQSADPSWQPVPYPVGAVGGSETITLILGQLPSHTHAANATTAAGARPQPNTLLGTATNGATVYGAPNALVPLSPQSLAPTGGNQPHSNMQPFETINFNIALTGIYPSRS